MKERLLLTYIFESPFGELLIGEINGELCLCVWQSGNGGERIKRSVLKRYEACELRLKQPTLILLRTMECLENYFLTGVINDNYLPCVLSGTDFQLKVWNRIMSVQPGQKMSYRALATSIGSPLAVRAVANAVGMNSLSIIIPCHRIVGSDGSLTGYAGGLEVKRSLLNLEERLVTYLSK